MDKRKLAIDPLLLGDAPRMSADDAELAKQVRELRQLLLMQIVHKALLGDALRTGKAIGSVEHLIARELDGNAMAAKVHLDLIDRLETLIREGFGLTAALYKVLGEKWLIRIDNLEMGDSGCYDQQEANENE